MYCPDCGEELPPDDEFCYHCGAAPGEAATEGAPCANCQAVIDPEARRCPECGNHPYRSALYSGAIVTVVGVVGGVLSSPYVFAFVPLGLCLCLGAYLRRDEFVATEYDWG